MISMNPTASKINFTQVEENEVEILPNDYTPMTDGNGNPLPAGMSSALEEAQRQAELGDQTIYANVDEEGYILSLYKVPAGAPEGTPWIYSQDEFDLDGYRIMAHKYDAENHTLIWDQEKYDSIIAGLKADAETSAKNAEAASIRSRYNESMKNSSINVDDLLDGIDLDI